MLDKLVLDPVHSNHPVSLTTIYDEITDTTPGNEACAAHMSIHGQLGAMLLPVNGDLDIDVDRSSYFLSQQRPINKAVPRPLLHPPI